MAVNCGGYMPLFGFRLTAEEAAPYIIDPGNITINDVVLYDCTQRTTTYVTAEWATQYLIRTVVERTQLSGVTPAVTLTSEDTNKATIDQAGSLTWVSDGDVLIRGDSPYSNYKLPITLTTTPATTTSIVTYIPETFNASDHMLIVYNNGTYGESTVKDYYLNNRPGMSTANTLACTCTTSGTNNFETITKTNFDSQIGTPIINFLATHPKIRYILLSYAMPSRISSSGYSVQYYISKLLADGGTRTGLRYEGATNQYSITQYPGMTALVSSLNMPTAAAAIAYIDKLKAMYNNMTAPNTLISATNANYNTSTPSYYFDDCGRIYTSSLNGYNARTRVLEANADAYITYARNSSDPVPAAGTHTSDQTTHITSASNVTGYQTWGNNGGQGGSYAQTGVVFSNSSGWYIILTIESFNGQRSTYQGNISDWFAQNAFGSTNYEYCPVFAVSHVEEPFLSGINSPTYFKLWEQGLSGIECGWSSRNTPYFQAVGDPMVKK